MVLKYASFVAISAMGYGVDHYFPSRNASIGNICVGLSLACVSHDLPNLMMKKND